MKEKIILDTDIGSDIDDADALLFGMKSDDMEISMITTVYGKVSLRAKIAKKLVDSANYISSVHIGESLPIRSYYNSIWHTNREGEGLLDLEDIARTPESMGIRTNAVDDLIEQINLNPGKYNLVTIGALTNIARALQKDPSIQDKLKHHYFMGGSFSYPYKFDLNDFISTDEPEHNIACDVDAAQIVLSSRTPKTMVPLDVTSKTPIKREDFKRLEYGNDAQKALSRLTEVWFDYRDKVFKTRVDSTSMHDPLTLALVTRPEFVKTKKLPIYVNNAGITLIDRNRGNLMDVAIEVDSKSFEEYFLRTIYSK